MKALIVDDEPLARRELRRLLAAHRSIQIVGEAGDIDEARGCIESLVPEIVFLDIQMPGGTGFDLLMRLDWTPRIIFTTAYDRYAVEAFDRGAVDYVLKPASVERLADTVKRLQSRMGSPAPSLDALIGELSRRIAPSAERLQWLQASLGNTLRLVNVDDVIYFQSDTKYTRVVTRDTEALVKKTLRELCAELDPRHFWQVHRGTIVNIRAIASVTSDETGRREIALRERPEKLEVSRTFAHLFKAS